MFHAEKMFHAKNKKRLKKIKNSVAIGKMGVIICLMNQTSNIFTQVYSVLENGIRIPCALEIGSFYQTQWGAKKVVSRYVETFSLDRNEPEGV